MVLDDNKMEQDSSPTHTYANDINQALLLPDNQEVNFDDFADMLGNDLLGKDWPAGGDFDMGEMPVDGQTSTVDSMTQAAESATNTSPNINPNDCADLNPIDLFAKDWDEASGGDGSHFDFSKFTTDAPADGQASIFDPVTQTEHASTSLNLNMAEANAQAEATISLPSGTGGLSVTDMDVNYPMAVDKGRNQTSEAGILALSMDPLPVGDSPSNAFMGLPGFGNTNPVPPPVVNDSQDFTMSDEDVAAFEATLKDFEAQYEPSLSNGPDVMNSVIQPQAMAQPQNMVGMPTTSANVPMYAPQPMSIASPQNMVSMPQTHANNGHPMPPAGNRAYQPAPPHVTQAGYGNQYAPPQPTQRQAPAPANAYQPYAGAQVRTGRKRMADEEYDDDTQPARKIRHRRDGNRSASNNPREFYNPGLKPADWDVFKYEHTGEWSSGTVYSAAQLGKFMLGPERNGKAPSRMGNDKLTLRIQYTPAFEGHRYGGECSICRWEDCPIKKNTISKGQFRVAFDERPRWSGSEYDPFHVAGYMHLYCFEEAFELYRCIADSRFDVQPETREFPKEERNPMALPGPVLEEYNRWVARANFVRDKRVQAGQSLEKFPKTRKVQRLYHALTKAHIDANPATLTKIQKQNDIHVGKYVGDLHLFQTLWNERRDIDREARRTAAVMEVDDDDEEESPFVPIDPRYHYGPDPGPAYRPVPRQPARQAHVPVPPRHGAPRIPNPGYGRALVARRPTRQGGMPVATQYAPHYAAPGPEPGLGPVSRPPTRQAQLPMAPQYAPQYGPQHAPQPGPGYGQVRRPSSRQVNHPVQPQYAAGPYQGQAYQVQAYQGQPHPVQYQAPAPQPSYNPPPRHPAPNQKRSRVDDEAEYYTPPSPKRARVGPTEFRPAATTAANGSFRAAVRRSLNEDKVKRFSRVATTMTSELAELPPYKLAEVENMVVKEAGRVRDGVVPRRASMPGAEMLPSRGGGVAW